MSTGKLKIGILTLTFNTNYGGLLQAFALQKVLENMGHEVLSIYRVTEIMPLKMKVLSFVRRFTLRTFFGKKVVVRSWPSAKEQSVIAQHTNRFLRENIALTDLLKSEKEFGKLEKYGFDAYIVGSDQVWRPKYSPNLQNHFLGFLNGNTAVRRISYAASFGVDNWEYTPSQTLNSINLAQKFHSISVREDSAINLCRKFLGVEAIQHVDPTMLLIKEDYIRLVEKEGTKSMEGSLFNYVLDITPEKMEFINNLAEQLQLVPFSATASGAFRDLGKNRLEECVFPPVTTWIRGFMDAEFVITDSFHGTVFSIIFNKQFIAIGNKKRGMTRFTSLLKMFDIEYRLIDFSELKNIDDIINKPINFVKVNKILQAKRKEAVMYLQNALQPENRNRNNN